jgi:hypothetical protein
MSRRARPRFDRRVLLNPIAVAIELSSLLQPRDRLALQGIITDALDKYRRGVDCDAHWRSMADALNLAEGLARIGIASDDESRDRIDAAQKVLFDAQSRFRQRGTWALRAAEMQALDDGLWVARVQLDHCTLGEYERAHKETQQRIAAALAGNAPAGALIIDGGIFA